MRFATLLAVLAAFAWSCSCGDSSAGTAKTGAAPDADHGHNVVLARCILCHQVEGRGGALGPSMTDALGKVSAFLPAYADRAAKLEAADPAWYKEHKSAIQRIASETEPRKRLATWLDVYLVEPKFDQPDSKMLPVPMTDSERADVVAWLLRQAPPR